MDAKTGKSVFARTHFSSAKMDWRTPRKIYEDLDVEFGFDFDPCPANPQFDGLAVEWGQCNFVNPPYGREIAAWIRRGYEQWQAGKTVVFLIPSRTDSAYWHDFIMRADEIRFIRGRLRFEGAKNSAPFPSTVVVFRGCP
jgi:site-specific DNA-methyltransferase (adenine-specific)